MSIHSFAIESERLMIRQLEVTDLDVVSEMLADPEVMRYWPRTYTRSEAADWIARHRQRYDSDGYGYWLASRKEDGAAVGQVGLLRQEFDGLVEVGIGYILHRSYWRQGYAAEGAEACLKYGFEKLGLSKVVILIRPENTPSLRVAERLKAQDVGSTTYAGFEHKIFEVRPNSPEVQSANPAG